ncbi:MAG: hypothetical protein P1U57_04585, partial [Oleibacter sp.]|nr:hypothetical protein [Thalassolituus sp.]
MVKLITLVPTLILPRITMAKLCSIGVFALLMGLIPSAMAANLIASVDRKEISQYDSLVLKV